MIPLLNCIATLFIIIVPNTIIWYVLKYFNLHEWLYIPRRTKFAQVIQFGSFLIILPLCYVTVYDLLLSSFVLPPDYGLGTSPQTTVSLLGIALVLLRDGIALFIASFGVFIEFLQFWIKNSWVKWVVETYPDHYREILIQARQERKKAQRIK